jgi:hypothetical protein
VITTTYITRRQAHEHIANVIGIPMTWSYLNLLCKTDKGPAAVRYYGRRSLYLLDDVLAWVDAYLRPADKAAAA